MGISGSFVDMEGGPSPTSGVVRFNSADGGPKTAGLNIYKL